MRAVALAIVLLCIGPACSTFDCSPVTCARGCCDQGLCFEGTSVKAGGACPGAGGGSGGGGGMGDAGGAVACLTDGQACIEGGAAQCCFLSLTAAPMACVQGACTVCIASLKRCDQSTLPCCVGACSSSGYCDAPCAYVTEPCNGNQPCCKRLDDDGYNDICVSERCTFCSTRQHECKPNDPYDTPCCPGLKCALKPGFSTVYSCQ